MRRRGAGAAGAVFIALLVACAQASAATVTATLAERGVMWVTDPASHLVQTVVPTMTNAQKMFVPDLVVIPAGGQVRFPNDDPFYHSVYSTSPVDPFDIGFYDEGPGKLIVFPNPGIVEVHCHIHAMMRATIVVVDGPWSGAEGPGTVAIDGVHPGSRTVHVWTLGGGERTQTIHISGNDARVVAQF